MSSLNNRGNRTAVRALQVWCILILLFGLAPSALACVECVAPDPWHLPDCEIALPPTLGCRPTQDGCVDDNWCGGLLNAQGRLNDNGLALLVDLTARRLVVISVHVKNGATDTLLAIQDGTLGAATPHTDMILEHSVLPTP